MKYVSLVLLILALARPQFGTLHTEVLTEGINIVLALDISETMAALDFNKDGRTLNRLDAVKSVVKDFCSRRSGDRIGMVVFGSNAYTQLPLTRDYQSLDYVLDRLRIGSAGPKTAIGDAIGISIKRVADIKSKSNIIILLTDGRSNSGELDPMEAAAIALERKIKIYTIGVGGKAPAPFIIDHPLFGKQKILQEVEIDEELLYNVARKSNGLYFHADNLKGLKEVYDTIDEMEKSIVKVKDYAEYNELYPYFLIPAAFILLTWIILINTRFLRIP